MKEAEIARIAQERHDEMRHEIADIAILLSYLAHELGIDIDKAFAEKLELNSERYPVDKAKGSDSKYGRLD